MARDDFDTRLRGLISQIKDDRMRACFSVSQKSRKYPQDCITDGGLDMMVSYVLKLEGENDRLRAAQDGPR